MQNLNYASNLLRSLLVRKNNQTNKKQNMTAMVLVHQGGSLSETQREAELWKHPPPDAWRPLVSCSHGRRDGCASTSCRMCRSPWTSSNTDRSLIAILHIVLKVYLMPFAFPPCWVCLHFAFFLLLQTHVCSYTNMPPFRSNWLISGTMTSPMETQSWPWGWYGPSSSTSR